MSQSPEPDSRLLRPLGRLVTGATGSVLIACSVLLAFLPLPAETVEYDSDARIVRRTTEARDLSVVTIAFLSAGTVLLAYAVNGVRFSKVSARDFAIEVEKTAAAAENYYGSRPARRKQKIVEKSEEASPEPTSAPVSHIDQDDGTLAIYTLGSVPPRVLADVLTETESTPNLEQFDFAARKTGKGNHPWTIKFRGRDPIVVSYGGQGKIHPTVRD